MYGVTTLLFLLIRKAWVKRQTIVHTYGDEDDEEELVDSAKLRDQVEKELRSRKVCGRCGSLTQAEHAQGMSLQQEICGVR